MIRAHLAHIAMKPRLGRQEVLKVSSHGSSHVRQVLREGLHPDGRRQLRLIQIHQHLRIRHSHFDAFVRRALRSALRS